MILLSLLAIATAGAADPAPAPIVAPQVRPAVNPLAVQFDLASKATGRTYRISVAKPAGAPPAGGWPVVYVLDADIAFATVAAQNMLRAAYGEAGAVIVGVGYSDPVAALTLRNRDLTPTAPTEAGAKLGMLGAVKPGDYGGGAEFRRFLTAELRPAIAALAPVDRTAQTLIGYSYGGLFALDTLFTDPAAFGTYVIGSPSIWWNEREILAKERGFTERVRSAAAAPRVLITSGELEQDPGAVRLPSDPAQRAATIDIMNRQKMVDSARDLAARLRTIAGRPGYRVEYVVFAGETHLTGIPAAVSRGLDFAMRR